MRIEEQQKATIPEVISSSLVEGHRSALTAGRPSADAERGDKSGVIRVTDQVGVTVFRLADEGGRLKVSEVIWMPYDLK
ncbi:MAG TPA: hypothetical protein VEV13_02250 [Candidatus Limnocylindria bacterium]|nr:hypothetical protein [Candidatus Limnocylindria bacterium]